jgi:hypothetical protein
METRSVIQASANIVRITQLRIGDVYKRVDDESYGGTKIIYGVVTDLMNDGSNCFIEAIEYNKGYGAVTANVVCHSAKKDLAIFPTSPDEVRKYLSDAIVGMEKSISDKKQEILKAEQALVDAKAFVSGEVAKQLTAAQFILETTDKPF